MIYLDNLKCTGEESDLFKCKHNGNGITNCYHNQDAAVICKEKGEVLGSNVIHYYIQQLTVIGVS